MSCEKSQCSNLCGVGFPAPSLHTCSTAALPHCIGRVSWEPTDAVCPQKQTSFLSSLGMGSNILQKLAVGFEDPGMLVVGSADP